MEININLSVLDLEELKKGNSITSGNMIIKVLQSSGLPKIEDIVPEKKETNVIPNPNKPFILKFGKYSGQELLSVYVKDKDYIDWQISSTKDPSERELAKLIIAKYEKSNNPKPVVPKEVKKTDLTDDQILNMKNMKKRLKIDNNKEINNYVYEWSAGKLSKWQDLNKSNIDKFIDYMNSNY